MCIPVPGDLLSALICKCWLLGESNKGPHCAQGPFSHPQGSSPPTQPLLLWQHRHIA